MGLTKREAKRDEYHAHKMGKQSANGVEDSHHDGKPETGLELNPWTAWISQIRLNEQEVPEFFRTSDAMKQTVEIMEDEEVLQTTTCTPKDIDKDPKGWKVAFQDELDSFDRLDVMDSVPLNTLDTSTLDILPCKVVMVKKPQGDGTHRKKGRVVVCGNFQQVQPGEETCANTPSFPMLRTLISLAALYRWAVESWDVSTAFLYAPLIEKRDVYCKPPQVLVKLGLVQPGTVWKLKKALYGLRTSPRAWEEERDRKLSTLTWDSPVGKVGLKPVDTTHCVWTIRQLDNTGDTPPLGMVIAYVDDLIAVGDQSQLDYMKSELDKLYVMKTSGSIPAQYQPGLEPLRFLGCLIERMPDGQIIMHQRSYIEHCFRENDMELMKGGVTLPNVDEKGSPEAPIDQHGHPTEFEKSKSTCQKYIGQLMWLATRTRPDISPVLGMIASQMVIRPTEMAKLHEYEECQRCMNCLQTVHQCCLFQDQSYERIPVCLACQEASSSTDPPPLPPPELPPPVEDDELERPIVQQPEPELIEEDYFTKNCKRLDPCHVNFMEWIISPEIQNANFARRLLDQCIVI